MSLSRARKIAVLNLLPAVVVSKAAVDTVTRTYDGIATFQPDAIGLAVFLAHVGLTTVGFVAAAVVLWTGGTGRTVRHAAVGALAGQGVQLLAPLVYPAAFLSTVEVLLRQAVTALPFVLVAVLTIYATRTGRIHATDGAIVPALDGRGWLLGSALLLVGGALLFVPGGVANLCNPNYGDCLPTAEADPVYRMVTYAMFTSVVLGGFSLAVDWRSVRTFTRRFRAMGPDEMPIYYHVAAWGIESTLFALPVVLSVVVLFAMFSKLGAAGVSYPYVLPVPALVVGPALFLAAGELYLAGRRFQRAAADYRSARA